MRRITTLLALCTSLTACGLFGSGNPGRQAETENELPYRAKLTKGEDTRDFAVTIDLGRRGQPDPGDAPPSVDDLRESARFEATKYCLLVFGGSDVTWVIDPQTDDWALSRDGDVLGFKGRCSAR